jgi:multisubunit Na+/H+ antiporter MnhC subunit
MSKTAPYHGLVGLLASTGDTALAIIITLSIVVPLAVLGLVIFLFFRAARRYDADQRRATPDDSG